MLSCPPKPQYDTEIAAGVLNLVCVLQISCNLNERLEEGSRDTLLMAYLKEFCTKVGKIAGKWDVLRSSRFTYRGLKKTDA